MQTKNMRDFKRSLLLGIGLGIALAAAFCVGFVAREFVHIPSLVSASTSEYPLLDEVQTLLDEHYLRQQPSYSERQYAAIRGMLSSLNDRFTFFIDPPVAASESDALAGTYGGVGVQIQRNEQGEFALYPYADSPAIKAGIANGDVLTAINGRPLDPALGQDAIDQMMRGEVKDGNGVQITVRRATSGEDFTVFIPFEVINVPSVLWHVLLDDPSIGYVQITRFTGRTPDELRDALTQVQAQKVTALVLDLRNNTGGLLQESIQSANAFIASGPLVFEADHNGEQAFDARPEGLLTKLPLAVLVNGYTASGAELVAGAIQDDERGVLIGQKTFGKGTVQEIFPLSDKSSLHVTAAQWLTPKHHALDQVGLQPDIVVTPDPQGKDLELSTAVQYLQQQPTVEATPELTAQPPTS